MAPPPAVDAEALAYSLGHGLRALAGTWSDGDLDEFERATAPFDQVDEELWS